MKGHGRSVLWAFAITAIVFAVLFFLLGKVLIPTEKEPVSLSEALRLLFENDNSGVLVPKDDPVPTEKDTTVSVLLIGLDYRPDDFSDYRADAPDTPGALGQYTRKTQADFIAVACVDTKTKELTVITIPEDSVLTLNGRETSLKAVYGDCEEDYFRGVIATMVGFTPDYTLAVNICDVGRIVELAGNAVITVPCDMYLENDRYTASPEDPSARLLLSAGEQYITKSNAVWLLSFDDYSDGNSRASTVISFANTLMSRLTTLENLLRIDELYDAVKSSVRTDVTIADVRKHISILLSYSSYTVKTRTYPGVYSAEKDAFLPDTQAALDAFTPYR